MTRGANQIDYHCLVALGACGYQVRLFRRVFGDGPVPITVANVRRARPAGLSDVFLECAMSADALDVYNEANTEAWTAYLRAEEMAGSSDSAVALVQWGIYRDTVCAALVSALNTPETP